MLQDGHLVVTKEVLRTNNVGGTARDRRRLNRMKAAPKSEWRKAERKIFRTGTVDTATIVQPGVEIIPPGSEEMVDAAKENNTFAEAYIGFAKATVGEIEASTAAFKIAPIPKMRVVLFYESGAVEEL